MGTTKQKRTLVSNIMGVPAESVKEVFKVSAKSLPCVYLFSLGLVKKLDDMKRDMELLTEKCKSEIGIMVEKHKNELLIEKHRNETLIDKHKNELLIEKHKNELLLEKHKSELQCKDQIIERLKGRPL